MQEARSAEQQAQVRELAAAIAERDHWLVIQSHAMFPDQAPSASEAHLSRLTDPENDDAARRYRQNRIAWLSACVMEIERR